MSLSRLAHFTMLPELELLGFHRRSKSSILIKAKKTSEFEVCPRCAKKCSSVYDHREVTVKDAPFRNKHVFLSIRKRRFFCKGCAKVFMEPISGISKSKRYTQRFKSHVLWACENFTDLKSVKRQSACSYGMLYSSLYEQLELNRRMHAHPSWPKVIGIDEHSFKRNKKYGYMEFATMLVDHRNRRTIELVEGKTSADLKHALKNIPQRSNVSWVTMDLSMTFRSFAESFFPRAQIVADKFHVVRLLDHHINRYRKQLVGDRRTAPIGKLLLKNSHKLDPWKRSLIYKWLEQHPKLKELYSYKQAIHKLYRTKGYNKARNALKKMLDAMGYSKVKEIATLRRTLLKWQQQVLNYFKTRLTNARVEGFNNKAKLIKRRAYGYKSFRNYRLRVLNACS